MPKKIKRLTANSGAEVGSVVNEYLERKNLSDYIKFSFVGLQRLPGPVSIEIDLNWKTRVGGTVKIRATGSNGVAMTTSDSTILLTAEMNANAMEGLLEDAGLWQ